MDIFEQIKCIDRIKETRANSEYLNILSASGEGMGFSGMIPWDRNSPQALNNDFDLDGIPDALDNYFGQGAWHPDAGE